MVHVAKASVDETSNGRGHEFVCFMDVADFFYD